MDYVKLFIAILSFAIVLCSWSSNKDLFSPVKIYMLYSVFFYSGIYVNEVQWQTLFCYLLTILSVAVCLYFEPKFNVESLSSSHVLNCNKVYGFIWFLTIPGIVAKCYLIYLSGGLAEYISSLVFRVRDWAGLGPVTLLFGIVPALNLLYFNFIFMDTHRTKTKVFLYGVHFCVFLSIGLLTGSRSFIATIIFGQVLSYNYIVRPVKIKWAAIAFVGISLFAGVLGAIRDDFGSVATTGDLDFDKKLESTHTTYGIIPLEIIFSTNVEELQLGATYLTVFTNLIPRVLYPSKPNTGGVVFTEVYAGNQLQGLSNLATGSITEGVMNFGLLGGVFFGVLINLLLFIVGCIFYRLMVLNKGLKSFLAVNVILYFYLVIAVSRFSYSEFTDVVLTTLTSALFPVWLVYLWVKYRGNGIVRGKVCNN
ncbi:hypothetical protein HQ393_01410 [Chitinibacter bivalviorum]|uniref:Oligosaccharide repeat unit polymerase n=1 Tax=Chitinibacter bivalviorum TaxID=2739434 RepID=A0A7H9BHI9_9NEIS|nr:hypothetical protein [Chitinibacter bivalviorum]QLG87004.1 hypothetical protein HQ393_01410 [Chitinibacter bivalviorum]